MKNPRSLLLPVAAAVVVVVAIVLLLVNLTRPGTPGDLSPEAGFARDMGVHHAQAVEMSFAVRDESTDDGVRRLAYDIITTQSAQRGMFIGWLQQWDLSQASSVKPMTWMAGHGHAAPANVTPGVMPGMATSDEMKRLADAKGQAAEVLFLQLMIRHHEGGVEMAKGAVELAERPEVRNLAQHIVDGQTAEIDLMKEMLATRGAQPLPSILK
ncbi:DUF305 domain-containing protein [Herbidospora galbida]|uniref:DUF305 domain-containing protein n=1 Tax=Herbidospora galbida TaxID=2575442 RepID=A0A4U3M6N4_9ACTN|nr:DUF305 domain-containing protein [Herbidospora galbida]TKK83849.1 DUF305 domain-containing protein [Herbidospora galbida]